MTRPTLRDLGIVVASFLSGAINQSCCVVWVHAAEVGRPLGVGAFGLIEALSLVFGFDQVAERRLGASLAWCLGYAIGPAVVVALRSA